MPDVYAAIPHLHRRCGLARGAVGAVVGTADWMPYLDLHTSIQVGQYADSSKAAEKVQ